MTDGAEAVLISIKPEWVWKIMDGGKTIEVRKTAPKLKPPFRVYVYCTEGGDELWVKDRDQRGLLQNGSYRSHKVNGTVCMEFICDEIYEIGIMRGKGWVLKNPPTGEWRLLLKRNFACMSHEELHNYLTGKHGYGWHIKDVRVYDGNHLLSVTDIRLHNGLPVERPPQSWCYVMGKNANE